MIRSSLFARAAAVAVATMMLAGVAPVSAADATPPTGGIELWELFPRRQVFQLRLTFQDPESGIDHVEVSCDDATWASYAFTEYLNIPYFDPLKGGCTSDGWQTIRVQAMNGAGLWTSDSDQVALAYAVQLHVGDDPTTGEPITITPNYPEQFVVPEDARCEWELRWGNDSALLENDYNYSFGSVYIGGDMEDGFCGPWTFTLPYGPVPHYQVDFRFESDTREIISDDIGFRKDGSDILVADIGTMERRITQSNLPVMTVLPEASIAEVGDPITYRLHAAGGAEWDDNDGWIAAFEAGEHLFAKDGGREFTFTPDRVGDWTVFWNAQGRNEPYSLGAGFDPPAKRADNERPNTTAPVTMLDSGIVGSTVPAEVTWRGSDSGWGIENYRLQRSIDGGAWGGGQTLRGTRSDWDLTLGHTYRFRIRARDLAGNVGAWDVGPTIRVAAVQESASALDFSSGWEPQADEDAWGGAVRRSDAAGASLRYEFTGRGIALVSSRVPGFGKAKVYVDGNPVGIIDTNAAAPASRRVVWRRTWSSRDTHRVRMVVEGNGFVDVDGFVVLR